MFFTTYDDLMISRTHKFTCFASCIKPYKRFCLKSSPKKKFSVSKKIYVYFLKEDCNQERIDYLPAYCGFCETNFSNRRFANQMAGFHKFVINNNHSPKSNL